MDDPRYQREHHARNHRESLLVDVSGHVVALYDAKPSILQVDYRTRFFELGTHCTGRNISRHRTHESTKTSLFVLKIKITRLAVAPNETSVSMPSM